MGGGRNEQLDGLERVHLRAAVVPLEQGRCLRFLHMEPDFKVAREENGYREAQGRESHLQIFAPAPVTPLGDHRPAHELEPEEQVVRVARPEGDGRPKADPDLARPPRQTLAARHEPDGKQAEWNGPRQRQREVPQAAVESLIGEREQQGTRRRPFATNPQPTRDEIK